MIPVTTSCGFAAVLVNLVLVWYLVRSTIEGTGQFDDILVSALCTAYCSGGLAFAQACLLLLGSMGKGGLDVSRFGENDAADSVTQVKQAYGARRNFSIGAGLLM